MNTNEQINRFAQVIRKQTRAALSITATQLSDDSWKVVVADGCFTLTQVSGATYNEAMDNLAGMLKV